MTDPLAPGYTCLWCGTACGAAAVDDLAALARLCQECLGRAGDNPFLRRRVRAAIEARARTVGTEPQPATSDASPASAARRAALPTVPTVPTGSPPPAAAAPLPALSGSHPAPVPPASLAVPLAAPPDDPDALDDWYLARGRFDRGPIPGVAWLAEIDAAVARVDGAGLTGRIVEPRCGVGFWSVLLASAGELTALDDRPGMADRAIARLVAHGLRAHVHATDPAAPPGPDEAGHYDGAFLGFALSRLSPGPRDALVAATRGRLREGGRVVVVDIGRPGIDDAHLRAALTEHLGGFRLVDVSSAGPDLIVAVAERAHP